VVACGGGPAPGSLVPARRAQGRFRWKQGVVRSERPHRGGDRAARCALTLARAPARHFSRVCRLVPAQPSSVDTPDRARGGCVDVSRHDRHESTHPAPAPIGAGWPHAGADTAHPAREPDETRHRGAFHPARSRRPGPREPSPHKPDETAGPARVSSRSPGRPRPVPGTHPPRRRAPFSPHHAPPPPTPRGASRPATTRKGADHPPQAAPPPATPPGHRHPTTRPRTDHPPNATAYSYASAVSGLSRAARRAGTIAARIPARTATTASTTIVPVGTT